MRHLRPALVLVLAVLAAAPMCGQVSRKPARVPKERVPAWWSTVPKVKKVAFIRAKAQSADKQMAIDKAAAGARGDVAASAEARWKELVQAIAAEDPQLPAAPSTDSTAILRGTRIAKQAAFRTKTLWTGFVLLEYPAQLVHEVLLQRLHASPEWYTHVKDTRAVRALESE